jgi:hypothetical protein
MDIRREPMSRIDRLAGSLPSIRPNNADGLGFGIEHDMRVAAFELADDMRHFLIQRELSLPIVRALTKYVGLDHRVQQIRRQLCIRNHHRLRYFVVHSSARPTGEPGVRIDPDTRAAGCRDIIGRVKREALR